MPIRKLLQSHADISVNTINYGLFHGDSCITMVKKHQSKWVMSKLYLLNVGGQRGMSKAVVFGPWAISLWGNDLINNSGV